MQKVKKLQLITPQNATGFPKESPNPNQEMAVMKKNKVEIARDKLIAWIADYKKKFKTYPKTSLDFYIVGRVLGKGAFGKVNMCLNKLSRKLVAIKSLHKQYLESEHNKKKFQNEVALLRDIKHKNVIRLYETFPCEQFLLLVIELCGGGDLLTYVRKRRKLTEPVAKVAFKQVFFKLLEKMYRF